MKQQITDLCGELNYAARSFRKRLPLVEKKIERTSGRTKTAKPIAR